MDDDEEKAKHCYDLYRMLREHDAKAKERISGICFANDDLYPGIQAADMIAHEARRLMIDKAPPSDYFRQLTCNGQHQPVLFDAEALQRLDSALGAGLEASG